MTENNTEIIEIKVKVIYRGEFQNYEQWYANVNACSKEFGLTSQLLHIDCNGYRTAGYDLKNTNRTKVYPVKTFLLVQDPEVKNPTPFKSLSNN